MKFCDTKELLKNFRKKFKRFDNSDEHDAQEVCQKLREVAITSPYLHIGRPVSVVVHEKPWGTHYRLKAYPIDGREQFSFISDMTVRGKAALADLAVVPVVARMSVPMSQE